MTARITKQNAKDKAFINGGGGGSGEDYPKDATFDSITVNQEATFTVNDKQITFANHESRITKLEESGSGGGGTGGGEFDTLHVKGNATIDGDILMASADTQSLTLRLLDIDASVSDHESRITKLEESGSSSDSNFKFTSGYPEIVIDKTTLNETSNNNIHTLTININKNTYDLYVGDILEFILPTEFKITDKVIISKQLGWKFTCPVITYSGRDYTLTSINEQDNPFLQIHSILDKPLSLYIDLFQMIDSNYQRKIINKNKIYSKNL